MDEATVLAALTEIFRDVFDDRTLSIGRKTTADDIEDWDSLENINVIVASEKEFSVRFELIELAELEDVGAFIDLILAKTTGDSTRVP